MKDMQQSFEKAREFIQDGNVAELAKLLKEHEELVGFRHAVETDRETFSLTLLHYAVGFPPGNPPPNAVASVKELLKHGADIEALDKLPKGSTPLQHAAGYNLVGLTMVLMDHGADPDFCEKHEYGFDATGLALFEGYTDLVKRMVEKGARVTVDVAAGIGDIDKLKTFFDENGAYVHSDTNEIKIDLLSPFLGACKNGQIESVEYMLELGADINLFPPGSDWGGIGASGLHWAVEHGHLDLVKFLVDNGADLKAEDDIWNRTPVQWAQAGELKEMIDYMEKVSFSKS